MDESSQGSVELLDSVDMVPTHVEKLGGAIRDEDLHSQYIAIQRVPATGQLLTSDIMQGHIQQHLVEEFSAHGEHDYYESHILHEHELPDPDRHLAELQQAVVEEPQNLSTPVNVVGDKPGLAAMVSAYIHTSGDLTGSHQIIIDTSERGSKLYQQRLPSLSSLPPLKKALTNSSIRSRYQRPSQTQHALENEVTLQTMTASHHTTIDGANVIVVDGHHFIQEDSSEGQRILEAEANGQTLLVEDPITQKLLQESSNVSHRLITQDNQRILVAQDATAITHGLTPTSSHRLVNVMNGHHRTLDVQADQNTRFLTHQEASVVTSLASQRLLAHAHQIPSQVQSQADLDMAERLLDEESPEHQMLVQEQLIHVVLDPETQEQLGVVSAPGQRVLVQGPGGQWTEIDPGTCEAEAGDHDSRDTTLGEVQEQEESLRAGLIVKHEEVELADGMVGDADGIADGIESMEGVADGSDGDMPVEDMNDSDYDAEGDMRTSRRSLPHKKRLSRKLRNPRKSLPSPRNIHVKCYKCNKCGEQFGTQASYASHRATHNPSNKKTLSFSCEICGKVIPNQLKFFEHLKAHYEPRSSGSQVNSGPSDASTSSEGIVTSYSRTTPSQRLVVREQNTNEHMHLKEELQGHIQSQQLQQSHTQQSHNMQVTQLSHPHHQPVQQPQQPAHQQAHQTQHQHQHHHHHHHNHHTEQPQPHQQHQQQHQPQHHRAVLRQPQHQQRQSPQQPEMQTIVLKVEDVPVVHVIEKPQEQIQIQESQIQELHQLQNHRQRPLKHQHDHLQSLPQEHHQRPHQTGHQTNHHQPQQSSIQQTVLDSEPPPLVPILPPVSTITGPVSLTCNLCGKNFRRQKTYETHLSVAHPKQEDIEQFSEPEDMMEGIRGVVEAGEESADDADSLVALTNLTPHSGDSLSKSHSDSWYHEEGLSEADLQALQQAGSGTQQQPQNHLQQPELSHMCDLCGDAFHSKVRLHQHLREEHLELRQKAGKKDSEDESADSARNKKALRRLACPQCDRVFNHRNSLVYHLRSHSGERPHRCEECGKSFFATSALKVHMRLHSGDKPYKCEFCGRSFRQWGDLKYHCTSRHSEEKQYQCEYCGKDFARKYSLIVHRRIHTGEKNYVCEFCNKQFRASSYLQNHRRIHTGEKPHRCEVCNKPFRVRSDMKRHLNTHNRDRTRVVTSGASNGPIGSSVRGSSKLGVPNADPEVDAQDSGDHIQPMHNIHLHELGNDSTITVIKTDSEGIETILPDPVPPSSASSQTPTTISLSTHTTDEGLQYTSERDPLDTRSHGNSQSATHVYVWPIYMT